MPQLPDASALGTRLVRPAYDVPQFPDNPIPRAIEGLGNAVAGLGSTLARNDKIDASQAKQEADRAESYGIGSQYFQFLQQQNEAYQKAQQDYQPGSANFAKTLGDNYDAAARKFFATVPEKYRPEYDLKLQQARADLIDGKDGADQFERGQLHSYYGNQLKSNLDSLLIQQKRNPLAWDNIEEQGVRRISALDPKIFTQAEKDDYIQQWKQNRSIAFANDHPVETQKAVDDQKTLNQGANVPIVTGTQSGRQPLNMSHMNPDLMSRFQATQNAFGKSVPIVSGYRDAATNAKAGGAQHSEHLHGNAIDIDVSGMSKEDRRRLIADASANGITGIGIYENSLHFDLGRRRVWGPSHGKDSVPAWAVSAASMHMAGKAQGTPGAGRAAASPTTIDALWPRLINQESSGDQSAVSSKGAIGVAQVMPGTGPEAAALAGLPWDEDKYHNDAEYNAAIGKAYLAKQMKDFGNDPVKALAAYNAGPDRTTKTIAKYGADWLSHMPAETQDYVSKILGGSAGPSYRGSGFGSFSPQQGQLPPQIAGMGYTAYAKWQDGIDSAIAAQNVKDQAALKEHLDLGIETGDVNNKDQIMQADLPDGDKATLLRRFDEKNKTDNAEADIANNLKNDIFFDPTTADAKKGLNAFYNNVAGVAGRAYSAVQALSGTDETASAKAFSVLNWMWNRKAAPMPDDAKATLVGMSRSTDDNLMVRGLAYLSNLQAANPVGFEQTFGADTVNKVTAYNQRISTDTPAQVATAIRNTQTPEYQQNIKPMYDDAMKDATKTYDTAKVMSLFDERGFLNWKSGLALSSPPGAPPTAKDSKGQILGSPMEMTLDFRRYYAEAVTNGVPDPEAAALSRLKTVWNVSPLNNGVVMKRPPELYYGNADWLKPNLESTLKDLGYVEKHEPIRMGRAGGQNVPDTVRPYTLMPVPRITEAQIASKQPPQYMILIQQPSGEYDVATDKQGQMVVWPSRNDPHLEHMKEVDQAKKDNAAAVTGKEAAQQADDRMRAQERGEGMFGIGIMPDQ